MKIILTIMLLVSALWSTELNWNSDYEKALKEAKETKKDLYMLITSTNCRWCRKFESTTLQDESVIKRLKQQYVLLHLNRDTDFIPKRFKKKRVPRHYFLTNDSEEIYTFLGAWNKEDFFSFLKDVDEKREIKQKKQKEKK
jgi:thioredoxin-related protein